MDLLLIVHLAREMKRDMVRRTLLAARRLLDSLFSPTTSRRASWFYARIFIRV
jgi:hypothetical protein